MLLPALVAITTAQATSGGSPYDNPIAVDVNPAPDVFETTLVAQARTVDIGNGVMANAFTYNGTIPGPQIRVKQGDTVIVHFTNQLPPGENTGIHWHGIELDNQSDGTPISQDHLHPGDTFLYKFEVPRPGIYWYHPHMHTSTNQAFRGLYGAIYVTDPNEPALIGTGVLPPASQTRTMVLSDTTVCKTLGMNDAQTYPLASPWAGNAGGGPPLPAFQPPPTPVGLCETSPINNDGSPRGPFAAGDIPNIQNAANGRTNEGQTVLTNGKNVGARAGTPAAPGALAPGASVLNVTPGQGLRLQFVNASTVRFFRLILTTNTGVQIPLVRIGDDNGLLDAGVVDGGVQQTFNFRYNPGELLLDPGDRMDVIAAIPPAATGVATLWTEDFQRTGLVGPPTLGFSLVPTVPVGHFNVTGTPGSYTFGPGSPVLTAVGASVETLGPPTGTLLNPAAFIPPELGNPDPTMTFTNNGGAFLGIDGFQGWQAEFEPYETTPHLQSTRWAKTGDTLELMVGNTTGADHPYHLHGFSMQPLSITRPGQSFTWPYKEFLDNIDIPAGTTFRFRVRLDEHPQIDGTTAGGELGRWMFHCHIFFHHTLGMVSELVVVKNAAGLERPYVDTVQGLVNALVGSPSVTTTGTFSDPNGLPVTLAASVGTVTVTGPGTWSWSLPTGLSPPAQIVYITATNSAGVKGQAAFQVRPRRPTVSGGGTINVPAGSYPASPLAAGPASFGFYSTYEKGGGTPSNPPVGAVSLGFGAVGLNFTGTAQTVLTMSGPNGSVRGIGRVNGVGGYSFLINFVDGSPDRFRIKIWQTSNNEVVFDNTPGAADDATPPPILSGAITVADKPV